MSFYFLHHNCYSGFKIAMAEERRLRNEPVVMLYESKGHYTVPGEFVRYAYPIDLPDAAMITEGEIEYSSVTVADCSAQRFKTVRFERERRNFFNRRSGRYMHSVTVCRHDDGEIHRDYHTVEGVQNLDSDRVKEEQR